MSSETTLIGLTTADQTSPEGFTDRLLMPIPGLILIWKPDVLLSNDRAGLTEAITLGRDSSCSWYLPGDRLMSRHHFSLEPMGERFLLCDLGARNGLFLDGRRLVGKREVGPGVLIRAGSCLFLLVADLSLLAAPGRTSELMAGRFHAGPLTHRLRVAAQTGRHVLLEGESGSGKELAAQVIHQVWGQLGRDGRPEKLIAHNAACFAGEDDAVSTLFGVSKEAFTAVAARKGALDLAAAGTLFLDEVHNLPLRAQRSLLRFAEDGLLRPLGGCGGAREVDVRLVLGTNLPVDRACDQGSLARDLVERLHRVTIPPLRERRADIPSIFLHVLAQILVPEALARILGVIDAAVMERISLCDFHKGNVRELQDLAALIGARLAEGEPPASALRASLDERLRPPVTLLPDDAEATDTTNPYERHREAIVSAYQEVKGNVSKLERVLKSRGIPCTRRWLTVKLREWGVKP